MPEPDVADRERTALAAAKQILAPLTHHGPTKKNRAMVVAVPQDVVSTVIFVLESDGERASMAFHYFFDNNINEHLAAMDACRRRHQDQDQDQDQDQEGRQS